MRTKSINDLWNQTERIRTGYGWKQLREKWDYDRFMAINRRVDEIYYRYVRAIGIYMREVEGMSVEQIEREYDANILHQYPASVYAMRTEV